MVRGTGKLKRSGRAMGESRAEAGGHVRPDSFSHRTFLISSALGGSSRRIIIERYIISERFASLERNVEGECMTYDVILRKKQHKYIARVRDWPEVVIEEETREAAIAQIKQHLTAYLSQPSEVIQIELEPMRIGISNAILPQRRRERTPGVAQRRARRMPLGPARARRAREGTRRLRHGRWALNSPADEG